MFLSLPTSLLALLFASPVLSAPTTPNDLFHDIAVYAPKPPEEPVCCLRPLPPLEPPTEDDLLLSFEEWKAKRLSDATEREPSQPPAHKPTENASQAAVPDASVQSSDPQANVPLDVQEYGGTQDRMAPHFRIPIHDRFNYASLDCSARVHSAHKSAKSPSSILSSKKDRYMLSPCEEKNQFVIVELCEDIRIDTVQLANYEFFSGVFKDFTVSVSKTYYPHDPDSWTFAGTFRAKNVRGVQSFHPPPTLRDFYRYIRIDFHSHYGNEYYCPLSLLRVYGLTHLEEWQWETWDAESRAKRTAEEASSPVEVVAEPPEPVHVSILDSPKTEEGGSPSDSISSAPSEESLAAPAPASPVSPHDNPSPSSHVLEAITKTLDTIISSYGQLHTETLSTIPKTSADSPSNDHSRSPSDSLYDTQAVSAHSSSVLISVSPSSSITSALPYNQSRIVSTAASVNHSSVFIEHPESGSQTASSHPHPHPSSVRSPAASPNVSSLSVISPSYSYSASPAPPVSTGGESIYRLIMNRLTALEANTTLYAKYVEEQTAGMREVLRRLSEDIGRLEGIGKAQAQLYQRSVVELEKQARRLESEHRELVSRVNYLTDEVVLEKRLGIAQLCLLLTVLVFMALTRGSRGEIVYPARESSARGWRRTLSLSGDWVTRLRTRSSTPPRPAGQKPGENEVAFPSLDIQVAEQLARNSRRGSTPSGGARRQVGRPHTPTSRHFGHHHRAVPMSPSVHLPRPGIQRSSSGSMTLGFGGIGPVPKSAKRWARSAHLHEVKAAAAPSSSSPNPDGMRHRRAGKDGEETPVASMSVASGVDARDPFSTPSRSQVLLVPASLDGTSTISKGKARAMGAPLRNPSPLRPLAPPIDLSSPPPPSRGRGRGARRRPSQTESEQSEGDGWVDTDVDGSECDLVVDAPAGSDALARERTYVGPPANSSL